jgi:hypothetical protein
MTVLFGRESKSQYKAMLALAGQFERKNIKPFVIVSVNGENQVLELLLGDVHDLFEFR